MSAHDSLSSGKGHTDENFPVASFLIRKRHRAAILAFYRFARAADDVADHPHAAPEKKLRLLDDMEQALTGASRRSEVASALQSELARNDLSRDHALDLLEAFRRDVTKLRYHSFDELMDYCRYSAMPVGRFVLDVHGESRTLWPLSDALCAALQIINHLQDCGKDFQALNRVYLPLDMLEAAGADIATLGGEQSSPALKQVIAALAARTCRMLTVSRPFAGGIADTRLGLEVSVIQRLAEDLSRNLTVRDPLCERVHHQKFDALRLSLAAAARYLVTRRSRPGTESPSTSIVRP